MLAINPDDRPSAEDILQLSWVRQRIKNFLSETVVFGSKDLQIISEKTMMLNVYDDSEKA